jgi:hypothetical protein
MAIFWLVILIGAAQAPLHVGNFPNLDACQKAANEMVRGSGAGTGATAGSAPYVAYVCVQANTGKAGDPESPD